MPDIPLFLPGITSRPQVSLEQRIAELESRLSEFMRRDLSNAGIGVGGSLRVLYGNGAQAVLIGTDPGDSKQKVWFQDPAGNTLYRTDDTAGFGLASPETPIPMYSSAPGVVFTGNTTDTWLMTGTFSPINSSFAMQWVANTQYGSGAAAQSASYAVVADPVSGWSQTSATLTSGTTTSALLNFSDVFTFTFPSNEIAKRCSVNLYARIIAGGAPCSVGLSTMFCTGLSRTSAVALGAD